MAFQHSILYIDPGTGSLLAQVLLAGIAACAVFFKNSFGKLFHRSKHKSEPEDTQKNHHSD